MFSLNFVSGGKGPFLTGFEILRKYAENFRRICMDSPKHGSAFISPPIYTNKLIFCKGFFFHLFLSKIVMPTNPIISQCHFCDVITSLYSLRETYCISDQYQISPCNVNALKKHIGDEKLGHDPTR